MTTLIGISTLTSEINFYTRLFKIRDAVTGAPIFLSISVELACQNCKDTGKSAECKHLLHLVPRWQSSSRHERLKTIMSDRPDLIQSELAGLAFDALQQCFRAADIEVLTHSHSDAHTYRPNAAAAMTGDHEHVAARDSVESGRLCSRRSSGRGTTEVCILLCVCMCMCAYVSRMHARARARMHPRIRFLSDDIRPADMCRRTTR